MRWILVPMTYVLITSCQKDHNDSISIYISSNERVAIEVGEGRFFYGPNMERPPSKRLQDIASSGDFRVGENCGFIGVSEIPLNLGRTDCKRFKFQIIDEGEADVIVSYCLKPSDVCPIGDISKPAAKFVLNRGGGVERIEVAPTLEYSAEYVLTEGNGIHISK